MTGNVGRDAESSPWTPREAELLAVTLQVLQEHGYEHLNLDAVAARARASKSTVYRRWPSKSELVLAAFVEGMRHAVVAPETGTLRGDLIRVGKMTCAHLRQHAPTIRAVLVEASRNTSLQEAMQQQFLDKCKAVINVALQAAVDRGEIDDAAINNDLSDVLPGHLIFRSIILNRPPTRRTVQTLVDEVIIPGLTRTRPGSAVR